MKSVYLITRELKEYKLKEYKRELSTDSVKHAITREYSMTVDCIRYALLLGDMALLDWLHKKEKKLYKEGLRFNPPTKEAGKLFCRFMPYSDKELAEINQRLACVRSLRREGFPAAIARLMI